MEDAEAAAIDRIFELVRARCDPTTFCEAVDGDGCAVGRANVPGFGAVGLLQLLTAGLEKLGARRFLARTAHLLQDGVSSRGSLRRRRIAVFGGRFDPITNAHLTCAAEVVHSHCADEVWLVPWGPRQLRTDLKAPVNDRYCMCQLGVNTVFSTNFPVRVDDTAIFSDKPVYTYDLLCTLRDRHPSKDFVFVIGSDWLKSLDWRNFEAKDEQFIEPSRRMMEEFDVLVIKRPGYEVQTAPEDPTGLQRFGPRLSWLVMPEGTKLVEGNLCSEEIQNRTALAAKVRSGSCGSNTNSIVGLVPVGVFTFMTKRGLYSLSSPSQPLPARRRRVAIYGGAYDPITNSHLTCAAQIVHSQCADEVWLVPCGPRPDKPNLKTKPLDRYVMCNLGVAAAFTFDFPVKTVDIECFAEESFCTYDLLCALRDKHPDIDFSFIIGSDWLQPGSNIAEWKSANWNWKEGDPEDEKLVVTGHKLLAEFDFLVLKRPGHIVPATPEDPTGLKQFGPRLSWLVMPVGTTFIQGNLSSTEIRRRTLVAGKGEAERQDWGGIDGLVPRPVLAYIIRQGLYAMSRSEA